jgi:hypothetical protein
MTTLTRSEIDAVRFHFAYAVMVLLALALPEPMLGRRLLALVLAYNLMLPLFAQWRGHADWLQLWLFLVPLSILQLLPDNYLAGHAGVLVFPDVGAPIVGHVPLYMAGLWVIPLFALLMLGLGVRARMGRGWAMAAVAAGALLLFAPAEWAAPTLSLWYPTGVRTVFGVAVYVLPAEVLLGLACFFAYIECGNRDVAFRLSAAASVSLLYLGALMLSLQLTGRLSPA